jgi:hypothetical protein
MSGLRAALKEWAAVEEAMHRGWVSVLVRKGGIWEPRGDFALEHSEFFVFPGVYHQNGGELSEPLRERLAEQLGMAEPDPVPLRLLARVEAVVRVSDEETVDALTGLHPLTPEGALARFRYRDRPFLHALLLRIHALPRPAAVRNSLAYVGCRSWLELENAISPAGATPVLADGDFRALEKEFWERLAGRGERLEVASGRAR